MKSMQVDLPDRMAEQVEALVKEGWFASEAELTRLALSEFIRRHRFDLQERFQLEDIEWVRKLREQRQERA